MDLESRTKQILKEIGINIKVRGYRYWLEAVKYVITNNKTFYSMSGEIYPKIAQKLDSTANGIERAMGHACEKNMQEIQKYFEINHKISNKELLALIIDKLESED